MRSLLQAAVTISIAASAAAAPAIVAQAAEPALSALTLSSGGVGQFDFTASVDGRGPLTLDLPLDQVDDLLKSLRLDDPAGPASVSLPGRERLADAFRTLPFGPDALASPEALLRALVGEAVRIPDQGVAGTVLAVNEERTALPGNGGTVPRHRLTLATATGMGSVVLEDVHGIEFASDALRRQVAVALAAVAARRVQDRRTAEITLAEGGARTVRLSYVVPVPVWKPTVRLTVPAENETGPVHLQAFAVVENLSGRDWRGVQLTLTSGEPVLFHQPLYEAVTVPRPEAPVDTGRRLAPAVDRGAMPATVATRSLAVPMPAAAPAPVPPPAPPALALPEPQQGAAQVQFRLPVPVTAAAGQSLLLPLIDRDVPGRRVALFQPETDALHPLVAVELTNDTAGAFPPALATLYQRGAGGDAVFIGDARLPATQPGEQRLASFAVDLAVRVDTAEDESTLVTTGKVAGGVLTLVQRERLVTTYRVAMPPDWGRTMVIETPRRPGYTVAEPAGAALTPDAVRVTRTFRPGEQATVRVVQEQPQSERVVLSERDAEGLLADAGQSGLPETLRAALRRAADLRTTLDRRREAATQVGARRAAIVADQARLRSNLQAVPANSELQRRYLGELQQQETDLAALAAQADAAERAVREAQAALSTYLQGLAL